MHRGAGCLSHYTFNDTRELEIQDQLDNSTELP